MNDFRLPRSLLKLVRVTVIAFARVSLLSHKQALNSTATWFIELTQALRVYQTQILQIIWLNVNEFACLSFHVWNLLDICDTFEDYLSPTMTEMLLVQVKSDLHRSRSQSEMLVVNCCLELVEKCFVAVHLECSFNYLTRWRVESGEKTQKVN